MVEKLQKLIPYKVTAICDCGGNYEPTGAILVSHPPKYPHKCNICGKTESLNDRYPKIVYREE